jgi:16S rRNA (cytidine1402-2'-O)-methyltransferase
MEPVGKVYLIPTVLSPDTLHTIPAYVTTAVQRIKVFFVENERTARRYMKALDRTVNIDEMQLMLMDAHNPPDVAFAKKTLLAGQDIGVISEAGCPAIADPGHLVVQAAHSIEAPVIPMVGPNSIILALMASGMNGQNFQFVGYLPVKPAERMKAIADLEVQTNKKKQTQIFIETPYRNNYILKDILATCKDDTLLCVAADITGAEEYIHTRTIKAWKQVTLPELNKKPAIFLLHAGEPE